MRFVCQNKDKGSGSSAGNGAIGDVFFRNRKHWCNSIGISDVKKHPVRCDSKHFPRRQIYYKESLHPFDFSRSLKGICSFISSIFSPFLPKAIQSIFKNEKQKLPILRDTVVTKKFTFTYNLDLPYLQRLGYEKIFASGRAAIIDLAYLFLFFEKIISERIKIRSGFFQKFVIYCLPVMLSADIVHR